MKNTMLLIILGTLLGGCSNTVWVREHVIENGKSESYKQIGGIPFYVKKEIFNQTTSYAQTWLSTTLVVEKTLIRKNTDGKIESFALDKQSFEKRLLKSQLVQLDSIKESILKTDQMNLKDVKSIVSSFSSLNNLVDTTKVPTEQIGNIISSKWVVNEEEKYYLNAPLPWFGSGNLTQELNADGTLAKVVSNPDTKLADGLSSLIPMKEYLTGKFVDPLKDKSNEEAIELASEKAVKPLLKTLDLKDLKLNSDLVYKVSLIIVESGYIYKFTKTHDDAPNILTPLPFDIMNLSYTRTQLGEKPKSDSKKKDGKNIGLSGTLNFPKDW